IYYQSEVDALIVAADSNSTMTHDASHDQPGGQEDRCRLCQLQRVLTETVQRAAKRENRKMLRTAVGLAVPCIEAWYLCALGSNPRTTEALWANGLKTPPLPYSKDDLKRRVYDSAIPSRSLMQDVIQREAQRLAAGVEAVERWFPGGFGTFAAEIRSW
ncbi:MAG: hypothetical protein L0Y44_13185, partial [Phycisphaerales bacterium]|nr:hypothetical protein [Phycisphaerales bacterium]